MPAMLKLCGFHISNYHNKVRVVLLEKGIAHEEDATCTPSQQPEEFLARTPIGKVPFLELDGGRRLSNPRRSANTSRTPIRRSRCCRRTRRSARGARADQAHGAATSSLWRAALYGACSSGGPVESR